MKDRKRKTPLNHGKKNEEQIKYAYLYRTIKSSNENIIVSLSFYLFIVFV